MVRAASLSSLLSMRIRKLRQVKSRAAATKISIRWATFCILLILQHGVGGIGFLVFFFFFTSSSSFPEAG